MDFPRADFLAAVDPRLPEVVDEKMPGRLLAPGSRPASCQPRWPRSSACGQARPSAPRSSMPMPASPAPAPPKPGVLVMVLGTSSCHMLNAD